MNFVFLKDFLSEYSLPTLIISGIIAVISLILDKFLAKKLPTGVNNYISFALAILSYFIYDMVFVIRLFSFRTEAFYAGILCGSLSAIIVSVIKKIKKGEPITLSATTLLIEKLLEEYVSRESATATAIVIEEILESKQNENQEQALTVLEIASALKQQDNINLPEEQVYFVAGLIVSAVTEFKKAKNQKNNC